MNSKQMMFFCVGMMIMLAGCKTQGKAVNLQSGRTISIYKTIYPPYKHEVSLNFDDVPVSDDTPRSEVKYKKRVTVTENGDSFQILIGRRRIDISPPAVAPLPPPNPILIQPLSRDILTAAQAGDWDITQMQLYISGTVVLEHEERSTGLTARNKSTPVRETLKGTNLTGPVSTNEIITTSAYENTLYVLDAMTPGLAITSNTVKGQNILEVSFDPGPNGTQQVLRFVQSLSAPLGYFYLDYPNKSTISYGGKNYEIRFDGKSKMPPYLMIRTELPPSVQNSNSLLGRRP
jgi:hypothetical protein